MRSRTRADLMMRPRLGFLTCVAAMMLVSIGSARQIDRARHVTLDGTPNLRDLGGYATADGRHVRWGRLYRSGQLAQLTERDYATLARLGISAVCDFRSDAEKQAAPTRWRGPGAPEILSLPNPGPGGQNVNERLANGATAAEMRELMRRSYARMVVAHAPSYRITLQRIVNSDRPLLYHCSAGKDRTGVFTALLLSLLGVPRATIVEDYLLSNDYVATDARVDARAKELNASPAAVRALIGVERAYLDTAFQSIDQTFGSLDAYRRAALGLSDDDFSRLRSQLLEP